MSGNRYIADGQKVVDRTGRLDPIRCLNERHARKVAHQANRDALSIHVRRVTDFRRRREEAQQ